MSSLRHLRTSVTTGLLVSAALGLLMSSIDPDQWPIVGRVIFAAQFPGWLAACVLIPGSFESLNTAYYIAIAIPANTIVYAILTLAVVRVSHRFTA